MFSAFIDDSGSHAQSPIMILAALVAETGVWDKFSDDWQKALDADKSIRYFKSSEAATLTGCFEGFTRTEAEGKTDLLTDITLKHILYSVLSAIRWCDFVEIIQASGRRPRGAKKYFARHPYFLCFHDVISCVAEIQLRNGLNGKVDFMFDNQDTFGKRCIRLFNELKPNMPEALRSILGEADQGDDKTYLPLQAADLIAWQNRNKNLEEGRISTSSYTKIVDSHKVCYNAISRQGLRDFVHRDFNLLLDR